MNLDIVDEIKKIAIVAMVSDDILMENLVLKGGNAINLIHNLSSRASIDLDYSMEGDFIQEEFEGIKKRIKSVLETTFYEYGFTIFDFKFYEKPEKTDKVVKHFWGGYTAEFKLIKSENLEKHKNIDNLRRNAIVIGKNNSTKYLIDISKYEFVGEKVDYEIEGFTLFAYTPEMIICEKIRALCQQIPEYKNIVKSLTPKSRARDFFDIYTLIKHFKIDLSNSDNIELLKNVLAAKKVPIEYLSKIAGTKELHVDSYPGLRDTIKASEELKEFDFYFDFLINKINEIVSKM